MDLTLTEEQIAVRDAARDFAHKELLPGVIERDKHQIYPEEQIKKLGELGFLGMMVSPEYNGGGMDTISYALAMEEISKIDSSVSVCMSVNNSLVCWAVEKYGSKKQKENILRKLAGGEKIGAFCLSEPDAGSDATAIKTSAEDKGDHYLLNGTKNWITNGANAGYYIVFAQADPEMKHRGIIALIVEKGMEGFSAGAKEDKLGIRASDTTSLRFENVKVPKENLLGSPGEGFAIAMSTLNGGRIGIAAQATGIAAGAYELSVKYAKERQSFGKLIAEHQAIQFKLAEMATKTEAARNLTLKAASEKDKGKDYSQSGAIAKLYAAETAMNVTVEAVQIHGGYGYVKEYHVERLMRDAKITQIYEGTSEIQKIVISRGLLKK